MKYQLSILLLLTTFFVKGQTDSIEAARLLETFRTQVSVDVGGLLIERPNLAIDHRFHKKYAAVLGFETIAQSTSITIDTIFGSQNPKNRNIGNAWHRYIVYAGLREYWELRNPLHSFWLEGAAFISVGGRELDSYSAQLSESIYPRESLEFGTILGVRGGVGYRHIFRNGISVGGNLGIRFAVDQSVREFDPSEPNTEMSDEFQFDFTATPAFLTLGYVW